MATFLRNLKLREISFVDKGASGNESARPRVVLFKRDERANGVQKQMTLDEVLASLGDEQKAAVMAALEAAKGSAQKTEEPKPEDLAKREGLSADVRKALEQAAELAKQAKVDREAIEKLQRENKRREFIAKGQSLGTQPQLTAEDVGDLLMAATDKLDAPLVEKLQKHFASVAKLVKGSALMHDAGSGAAGEGGSAIAKLDALAKSIQEKTPGITIHKAMLIATEQDPQLAAEAVAEADGGR